MAFKLEKKAQGRIKGQLPVAVLDIGSNSIRMVIYERHCRALTPLYNEKSSCALGQGVAASGLLNEQNMQKALKVMRRFALVIKLMQVAQVYCVATSAVREAKNGKDFTADVEKITGVKVQILSGEQEAYYAALGAYAGIDNSKNFSSIVGDLGGGSLELALLEDNKVSKCDTFKLGVIRLAENSGYDLEKATRLSRNLINPYKKNFLNVKSFCSIGGSWRALAKLHQILNDYPLYMLQNYEVDAKSMIEFCENIIKDYSQNETYLGAQNVNSTRRKLLPFGAVVLKEILTLGNFEKVVFSTLGVREGYLYSILDEKEQKKDPLIQLCEELSILRSRSPKHSKELIEFSKNFFTSCNNVETYQQERLRQAACLLADIGWRGHPDYRGEQAVDIVAYGALVGVDHCGRAFLAQVLMVRYMGIKQNFFSNDLFKLMGKDVNERAKLLGAIFRVAFPLSAGMNGVLSKINFKVEGEILQLILPKELAFLDGSRLKGRLAQLANVANFTSYQVEIAQ